MLFWVLPSPLFLHPMLCPMENQYNCYLGYYPFQNYHISADILTQLLFWVLPSPILLHPFELTPIQLLFWILPSPALPHRAKKPPTALISTQLLFWVLPSPIFLHDTSCVLTFTQLLFWVLPITGVSAIWLYINTVVCSKCFREQDIGLR